MNRERILKGNTRQYISIADTDLLEQIGELLLHYTTFNKLANDALRIGIPILQEEKVHPKTVMPETDGVKDIPRKPILEEVINPQADEIIHRNHRRKKLNGGAGFAVSYPEQKKRQKIKNQPRP